MFFLSKNIEIFIYSLLYFIAFKIFIQYYLKLNKKKN